MAETDKRRRSRRLSVLLAQRRLLPSPRFAAKTAEPIEMPFGLRTRVGPWNHVLDMGVQIPHGKWQF